MKRIVSFFVVAAFAGGSVPANAHPSIPAVLSELQHGRVDDAVAISPDGTHLAWSEARESLHGTTPVTSEAVFVAPIASPGAAVQIRGCPAAATCDAADFAWSPDSKRLAFMTTGPNGQAELANATLSGVVVHLTAGSHGPMTSPKWSPDGRRIAVLYTKGAPQSPGPLNPSAPDAGVLGSAVFEQRIGIVPAGGGAMRLASPADLYVYEDDWSPDGSAFAATAAHGSGDDNWWVADLYRISAADGSATLLNHPRRQIASPRWSGDGKRIAYIGGLMSDESITGGDVYVVPATGGDATDVTPGTKASVSTIAWNGSRGRLIATYLQGDGMGIATIDVDSLTATRRWSAHETIWANSVFGIAPGDVGISVARDGTTSALIRQSFTSPPHIFAGPIGAWKPFEPVADAAPRVVKRARSLTWASDGFTPQGWLLYPDGYDSGKRYPMVVVVHGGPSYANYPVFPSGPDSFDAILASQGYFVFEPNPRGSYGQGEAFTHANYRDFGGGDLRDILAGVDTAEKAAPIDDRRVGIFGWSYGGYMTMWATTQTHRFRAAVSGAGLSDWLSYYGTNGISTWMIPFFGASVYDDPAVYAKSSPIGFIKQERAPTLMVAGDRDAEVPITQSYEYWYALKTLHIPTEFVVYPGEGHLFQKVPDQIDVARRLVGWFDRWLQ